MKTKPVTVVLISFVVSLFLASCGDGHDHGKGKGQKHHHEPPHDGVLIECGDHQYNLEVVHDSESGDLEIYVLGGHAVTPVRIKQESIEVSVTVGEKEQALNLPAIADSQQEKTVGDTDFFQIREALPGIKEFTGEIKSVTINGALYEKLSFKYPPEEHHHD